MSRIRFSNSAETDLLELWLNIAEENITAADETIDVIQAAVSLLATQPEMGRTRPELSDGLRSIPTRTRTLFSMWRMKKGCWSFECCIMRGTLTQNIFPSSLSGFRY